MSVLAPLPRIVCFWFLMICKFFSYSLQLPSLLFGWGRVVSHFPLLAKPSLPFALLNLHVVIIISNEKSANGNLSSCFSVKIDAGSSWAGGAGAEPVSQELSCLAGRFTCLMFLLVLHHKIKTLHLSNIFSFSGCVSHAHCSAIWNSAAPLAVNLTAQPDSVLKRFPRNPLKHLESLGTAQWKHFFFYCMIFLNRKLTPYRNGIGLLSSLKWGKTTRKSFLWWSALAKV